MSKQKVAFPKGLRLRTYEKMWTSYGRWVYNVTMDQYGRIGKGSGKEWEPSGETGSANH